MTSKISFSNQMREDRKRRTWTIVLFACLCLVLTVAFELLFENMNHMLQSHTITQSEYINDIMRLTGSGAVPYYLLLSGIGAMIFGFQGFAWLTKKQQVDFYHSLPVTRTKRFFTIYLNGILFFLIPMLCHTGLVALLVLVRGALTKATAANIICNLGYYILSFLLMYHLVILAVMMTGNILVSLLAAFTFLFYASALQMVGNYYCQFSFENYMQDGIFSWLSYLSPFERILTVFAYKTEWHGIDNGLLVPTLILIVMAGAVLLLAWKLYLIRPSERAGKALAFPKAGNVIRVLIVVPIAMVSGLFFSLMTGEGSIVWTYLGSIIGGLFFHGFMEVIFHFDIKAAFRKKIQLFGTLAAICLIVSAFQFDWFHYDTYLPKPEKLKTISYSIDFGDLSDFYYEIGKDGVPTKNFIGQEQYQYKNSKTEDAKELYHLIKAKMKKESQSKDIYKNLFVCYELQNGKKVYRQYGLSRKIIEEEFASIYESEQGKKTMYPALQLSAKNVEKVSCYTPFMEKTLEFKPEEIKELLDMYQKDLKEKTFRQYMDERTLGKITFTYRVEDGQDKESINQPMLVTDTCKNTIEYLKQKGISMEFPNSENEIEEMKISNIDYDEDAVEENGKDNEDQEFLQKNEEKVLTKEQQDMVIPVMVAAEYENMNSIKEKHYSYTITVTVKNKTTGMTYELYYSLAKEDAPDFLTNK